MSFICRSFRVSSAPPLIVTPRSPFSRCRLLSPAWGFLLASLLCSQAHADEPLNIRFADTSPQRYQLSARASELDSRVQAHPEIGFLIDDDRGRPADMQQASVDTSVAPRGKLVI